LSATTHFPSIFLREIIDFSYFAGRGVVIIHLPPTLSTRKQEIQHFFKSGEDL